MDGKPTEVHKVAVHKAISRGIATTGTGGYSRHLLVCISPGCCGEGDHRATIKRLNTRVVALKRAGIAVYRSRVSV